MQIRTSGGYERRSLNPGQSWSWNDSLAYTGLVPPHGISSMQRAGVSVTEETVTQIVPVNACIDQILGHMLTMGAPRPFDGWTYDKNNQPSPSYVQPIPPLLLNTWGPTKTQSEGLAEVIYGLALFGQAFILTVSRDNRGNPSALEVLCTPFMTVGRDRTGVTYTYGVGGNRQALDPDDVTQIKLRPRPGSLNGASSLAKNALAYALWLASMEFGTRFFGQGSSPSFVLTTDEKLSKEAAESITDTIIIEHSGLMNAHIPMLLDSGVKPQKMVITPDEAQFGKTLEQASDMCAAYFGVPKSWISGDATGATGKSLAEVTTQFVRSTLVRYYTPIHEALSKLLPGTQQCEYNERRLLRGTDADIARLVLNLRTATIMDADEIRREFYDLGPHAGGNGDNLNAPLASSQSPLSQPDPDADSSEE